MKKFILVFVILCLFVGCPTHDDKGTPIMPVAQAPCLPSNMSEPIKTPVVFAFLDEVEVVEGFFRGRTGTVINEDTRSSCIIQYQIEFVYQHRGKTWRIEHWIDRPLLRKIEKE
jgi:hypothetical protein